MVAGLSARRGLRAPGPVTLNAGHPLARGLRHYFVLDPFRPVDLVERWPVTSTTAITAATLGGHVYQSNGTSTYASCAALPELAGGVAQATMAGWMYRSATGTTAGFGRYLAPNRFSLIHFSDNVIYVSTENGSPQFTSVSLAIAGWHHYAVVFDGSGATNADRSKLYVDGVLRTTPGTVPTQLGATNSEIRWGADNQSGNRFWAGQYADTAFWSRALTANEVWTLYDPRSRWELLTVSRPMWVNSLQAFQPTWATRSNVILGAQPC